MRLSIMATMQAPEGQSAAGDGSVDQATATTPPTTADPAPATADTVQVDPATAPPTTETISVSFDADQLSEILDPVLEAMKALDERVRRIEGKLKHS